MHSKTCQRHNAGRTLRCRWRKAAQLMKQRIVVACKGVGSLGVAIAGNMLSASSVVSWFAIAAACFYFAWWHSVKERRQGLYHLGELASDLWWGLFFYTLINRESPGWARAAAAIVAIFYSVVALVDGSQAWAEIRRWPANSVEPRAPGL